MRRAVWAAWALTGGVLRRDVTFELDAAGCIAAIREGGHGREKPTGLQIRSFGEQCMLLPGFVNAHSHAFQRAIRGQTHHVRADGRGSFWSWRDTMYEVANRLDPSAFEAVTRVAFAEMLRAGITHVGEFHYLHHQSDGRPYDEPNELSWRVVAAAQAVGIRLTLLEVFYARGGFGVEPQSSQRRFCDGSVDAYLQRVDALRAAGVDVGLAPHSVRAVEPEQLRELVDYADTNGLVMHAHVGEQSREHGQCVQYYGVSPTAVFEQCGALARRRSFTAVHATHIENSDRERLAEHCVCICPSTEADLGDGIVDAPALAQAGVTLSLGSDSNSVVDLVAEARMLEMHDRLARQARVSFASSERALGPSLLSIASHGGSVSLGHPDHGQLAVGATFDAIVLDIAHPFFDLVPHEHVLDAWMAAGTAAPIRGVFVGGVEVA